MSLLSSARRFCYRNKNNHSNIIVGQQQQQQRNNVVALPIWYIPVVNNNASQTCTNSSSMNKYNYRYYHHYFQPLLMKQQEDTNNTYHQFHRQQLTFTGILRNIVQTTTINATIQNRYKYSMCEIDNNYISQYSLQLSVNKRFMSSSSSSSSSSSFGKPKPTKNRSSTFRHPSTGKRTGTNKKPNPTLESSSTSLPYKILYQDPDEIIDYQEEEEQVPNNNQSKKVNKKSSSSKEKDKQQQQNTTNKHRIDVAIVGLPNAGKSQLLNIMTQAKVAAVSRKRHTTRQSDVLGARTIFPTTISDEEKEISDTASKANTNTNNNNTIHCTRPTQILFVDTPGFLKVNFARKEKLNTDITMSAKSTMINVDYTLLVVDAAKTITDDVKETLIELIVQALLSTGRRTTSEDTDSDTDDDSDLDDDTDDDEFDSDSDSDFFIDDDDKNKTDSDNDDNTIDIPDDKNKSNNSMIDSIADNGNNTNEMSSSLSSQDSIDDTIIETTNTGTREKFAIVLNKVDLIRPKTRLLDIAEELCDLVVKCIKFNYRLEKITKDESLLQLQNNKSDNSDANNAAISSQVNENDTNANNNVVVPDVERTKSEFKKKLDLYIENDNDDDDDKNDIVLQQLIKEQMPLFFYVSAKLNDGIDDVIQCLVDRSTSCKKWDVHANLSSTLNPLEQIEEVIREKIYRCLHKEVPYNIQQINRILRVVPVTTEIKSNTSTTTTNTSISPNTNTNTNTNDKQYKQVKVLVIHQDLIVYSKSHQTLVYGGGSGTSRQTLERIRSSAEYDLSKHVFKCPVRLLLNVKLDLSKNNSTRTSNERGITDTSSYTSSTTTRSRIINRTSYQQQQKQQRQQSAELKKSNNNNNNNMKTTNISTQQQQQQRNPNEPRR